MPLVLKDLFSKKVKVGFVYFETQEKRGTHMSPVFISSRVALSQKKGLLRHANVYDINKYSFYVCALH